MSIALLLRDWSLDTAPDERSIQIVARVPLQGQSSGTLYPAIPRGQRPAENMVDALCLLSSLPSSSPMEPFSQIDM